jgi:outer membrane protein assembly factor BamB
VWSQKLGSLTAACRSRDGDTWILVGSGVCVRLDPKKDEVKRFPSNRSSGWTSGIDWVPGGKVLVAQPDRNQVSIFDREGKVVWQAAAPGVTTATWLPNGHVLVGSSDGKRSYELDEKGKTVWETTTDRAVFRARRR